ncbi:MAG: TdeIII family type II restriction endonuclease [Bacteroidetes bacterium]|nr:TdeIII family type II restriction endonuclease [Bacteroidota bacterium]MCL5738666.1 TdeIII family type II restriction endonuclease [Bacteroidota bacterium]
MAISSKEKQRIVETIKTCLRSKFKNYKPESNNMPFHFRLLGKDRMALYSFIQSLNTTFGTSIFEPVAVVLAKSRFKQAVAQYVVGNRISEGCQQSIQTIMNQLTVGNRPNKPKEIEELRKAATKGKTNELRTVKVDLFVESYDGEQFLFDLKTAKPNISNFKDFKRTLLEWAGIALTQNKDAKINTLIAIPYNPYEPEPYERWTIKGMIDDKHELKVAEEFWDFLGGEGTYSNLLDCFEKAGIELRSEIDEYFQRFVKK